MNITIEFYQKIKICYYDSLYNDVCTFIDDICT